MSFPEPHVLDISVENIHGKCFFHALAGVNASQSKKCHDTQTGDQQYEICMLQKKNIHSGHGTD